MPTITVKRESKVEVEVFYPLYKTFGSHVYKITEDQTIEVRNNNEETKIAVRAKFPYTDMVILDGITISYRDFEKALIAAREKLFSL